MRLNAIITRLEAECPSLQSVKHARAINAVTDSAGMPAAFVHSVSEAGSDNQGMQQVVQARTHTFAVLIAAEISDDADEPIEDAREEVSAALIGHEPVANGQPIVYAGGAVVDIDGARIWWRDTFSYVEYIRS